MSSFHELIAYGCGMDCPISIPVRNDARLAFSATQPATRRGGRMRCHTLHWRLAVWAMVVFSGTRVAHCSPLNTTGDLAEPRFGPALFSSQWAMEFGAQGAGCRSARGNYMWRVSGFGSNVNNMLNAWVYGLAVEGWNDMGVVIDSHQLQHVECSKESRGSASTGLDCIFSPMPHFCTFETAKNWKNYMVAMNVTREDVKEASRLGLGAVRNHPEVINAHLQGQVVDHQGALAVMAKYLWNFMTPWMRADVASVLEASKIERFQHSPYIGLHIRRGDKIKTPRAVFHGAKEYLSAAVKFVQHDTNILSVDSIKGIWVASNDPSALEEVRAMAVTYFPNVQNDTITMVSGGVPGGPSIHVVDTETKKQTYFEAVLMTTDLQQLAVADVFVGTYSSNIGRLVALLRESVTLKTRQSAISIDEKSWTPGRRKRNRRL